MILSLVAPIATLAASLIFLGYVSLLQSPCENLCLLLSDSSVPGNPPLAGDRYMLPPRCVCSPFGGAVRWSEVLEEHFAATAESDALNMLSSQQCAGKRCMQQAHDVLRVRSGQHCLLPS